MSELGKAFAPRGPAQLRSEIQNLIPRWASEEPTPIEWRTFAEKFKMLGALGKETISEVELRDHLLHHCLTDAQVKAVIKQERLRGEHPAVELHGMEEWERHQVEAWLKGEGVDVRDVEQEGRRLRGEPPVS
jgi:hypothetical protein